MENCLVTKLKGSVANSELMKLGELRFEVKAVENPTQSNRFLYVAGNVTKEVDGGSFTDIQHISNDNCVVHATPKYDATIIQTSLDANNITLVNKVEDILNFNSVLTQFQVYPKQATLNTEDIKDAPCKSILQSLTVPSIIIGDIANLSGFTALKIGYLSNAGLYGNIASIGTCISLTQVFLTASKCSGSITALAEAQVAAGRTTGSLFVGVNGIITKDGSEVSTNATIAFDSSISGGYSITYA
jgi:hypothetical protein